MSIGGVLGASRCGMLAKLQLAAATKRQQRIEASVSTIQRAWRRHCTQRVATATLRRPPPLPVHARARRRPRMSPSSVVDHKPPKAADGSRFPDSTAVEQLQRAQPGRTKSTQRRSAGRGCSCVAWPCSGHASTQLGAPGDLRLSPVCDNSVAPRPECSTVHSMEHRLVPPPPLPTHATIRTRSRCRHTCDASTGSGDTDTGSWRPARRPRRADAHPAVTNDIYKLLS